LAERNDTAIHSCNKLGYCQLRSLISKIAYLSILWVLFVNFSCGKQERTEPKIKTNSPPVISSVNILPEKPTKASELNSFVQSHDPDWDIITYQYQWLRNNEEIIGENKNSLKSGDFKKGDLIQVRVIPYDGKVNGTPFLSTPMKILNSPPVIQEVRIEPKVAYANDNLKVSVTCSDVDRDSVDYTYQWEKNGEILGEDKKGALERGRFKKGDSIIVTVTPDDRESIGKTKKSELIMIGNSPPIITSSPPNKTDGNIYTYQVTANDPDNDLIIFALKTGPKGMEVDKETGLIRWEIRKEDQGTQSIEIEASDSMGAKSFQKYTLSIKLRGY